MNPTGGPRRRLNDHVHPEYWTENDHVRFEDRIAKELHGLREGVGKDVHELREELKRLGQRMAWLLGGLTVMVFVVNIAVTVYLRILHQQ